MQMVQGIQGAGGGEGLFRAGGLRGLPAHSCAEIHQAATEAEEHGGQWACGLGYGIGVGHINVPEIAQEASGQR
nr:hypothetical protein FFPRI1PSEUD_22640 [Pseudomonas sp. FFPRI_1]